MKIDIHEDISYYLVKAEIRQLTSNPWIRPFLKYIHEHPNAHDSEICKDLFADNGTARVAAVKNILFFFKENGLLVFNKEKGYELTTDGLEALKSANIWQGKKGVFLFTIWDAPSSESFILNIQPVPEHWYDNAKNFPEDYSSLYDNDKLKLCFSDIEVKEFEPAWIETFQNTEFETNVYTNGIIKIVGKPKVKGLEEYQVEWIDEELTRYFIDEDEEEDESSHFNPFSPF